MAKISNKKYSKDTDGNKTVSEKNSSDEIKKNEPIDNTDIIKEEKEIKPKRTYKRKPKTTEPKKEEPKKEEPKKEEPKKEEPKKEEPKKEEPKKEEVILPNKSIKDIYSDFINSDEAYRVYHRGVMIFDSTQNTEKPILYDKHFILYNTEYRYRGIRFEKQ